MSRLFIDGAIAVTGAAGALGKVVVRRLADEGLAKAVVALDLRPDPTQDELSGVTSLRWDVRDKGLDQLLREHEVKAVVHLASIVDGRGVSRQLAWDVDVLGTQRVIDACLAAGVEHLTVTSSGAAYGYHADNPEWLTEELPLRGNYEFAYSHHKKVVEEMLAKARREHPELKQLVLRPGTILGKGIKNQITALFDGNVVVGLKDVAGPFVMIWDEDVAAIVATGVRDGRTGIFNLAGDGVLPTRTVASLLGKRHVALPPALVKTALRLIGNGRLLKYGPEQVRFLQFRPVLINTRLKEEFGYTPLSSRQVLELWAGLRPEPKKPALPAPAVAEVEEVELEEPAHA